MQIFSKAYLAQLNASNPVPRARMPVNDVFHIPPSRAFASSAPHKQVLNSSFAARAQSSAISPAMMAVVLGGSISGMLYYGTNQLINMARETRIAMQCTFALYDSELDQAWAGTSLEDRRQRLFSSVQQQCERKLKWEPRFSFSRPSSREAFNVGLALIDREVLDSRKAVPGEKLTDVEHLTRLEEIKRMYDITPAEVERRGREYLSANGRKA
ncbi:hypothetical protein JCM8097_007142 [Rhodosporidiobolus ruineniae]